MNMRPVILAAARKVAPHRLSLAEAARQAGCAKSTAHAHFGGLAGLLAALKAPPEPPPRRTPSRSDTMLELFADGSVLTTRDVADEMGLGVRLVSAHLSRLWSRGQLTRRPGAAGGFLYSRAVAS